MWKLFFFVHGHWYIRIPELQHQVNEINQCNSMESKRGKTGLVYDGRMVDHRCLWNDNYPECPERLTKIIDR